jgi:hypothetical protein
MILALSDSISKLSIPARLPLALFNLRQLTQVLHFGPSQLRRWPVASLFHGSGGVWLCSSVALCLGLTAASRLSAEQVLFIRNSDQGVFSETTVPVEVGTLVQVSEPPLASGNLSFTHWVVNGVRQNAVTGQAKTTFPYLVLGHTTVTAHYIPTADDTNTNGVPDWLELRLYGHLLETGQGADYDFDGDGSGHAQELAEGTPLTIPDRLRDGGLMLGLGANSVLRDESSKKRYEIRSEPQGLLTSVTGYSDAGTEKWTDLVAYGQMGTSGYYFGYWEIDGVRQASGSGLARPQACLVMDADHVAVARFFIAGDSDADGLQDWREWNWFGSLAQDASGDPDGDGIPTAGELARGSEPNLHDFLADGGVMMRLSAKSPARDEALKKRYEIRSEPQGLLTNASGYSDTGAEKWS